MEPEHPAAFYESHLAVATRRARLTRVALVGMVLALAAETVGRLQHNAQLTEANVTPEALGNSELLMGAAWLAQGVMGLATAILFLMWIHRTVKIARGIGKKPFRWRTGNAVGGFLIPFINIVHPYRIVRDLHDTFAIDDVPRPAARVREGDYRTAEVEEPPPALRLPAASIGLWWFFYLGGRLFSVVANRIGGGLEIEGIQAQNRAQIIHAVLEIVAAVLAVRVVTAISARAAERFRRIRHSSPELLTELGVHVD